jgi:Ala-tRNA(Pro) deacylase
MPASALRELLNVNHVKYVTISHSPAFTAQEVAASAHIPGRELAKTVVVKLDGELAMVVVPAARKVNFESLKRQAGAGIAELAHEEEFRGTFPGCELGAMPPFGNLYGMDVFVDEDLAKNDTIAFNAGSHTELISLPYNDFERLVQPKRFRSAS